MPGGVLDAAGVARAPAGPAASADGLRVSTCGSDNLRTTRATSASSSGSRDSSRAARIREAAALGFENVYLPSRNARETESAASVVLRPVERVTDLVTEIALAGAHGSARTSSRSGAGPIESEG